MAAVAAILATLLLGSLVSQRPAPDVKTVLGSETLIAVDGRKYRPEDLNGKVVLIDVWATWCAPCLVELPGLRELRHRHRDDLVIVGVSLDRMSRRDFMSWLQRHRVTWPQHFDGRGYSSPVARRLAVSSLPASFLLSRDGHVVARDLRGRQLRDAIDELVRSGASR